MIKLNEAKRAKLSEKYAGSDYYGFMEFIFAYRDEVDGTPQIITSRTFDDSLLSALYQYHEDGIKHHGDIRKENNLADPQIHTRNRNYQNWVTAFLDQDGNGEIEASKFLTDEQLTNLIKMLIEHKKSKLNRRHIHA